MFLWTFAYADVRREEAPFSQAWRRVIQIEIKGIKDFRNFFYFIESVKKLFKASTDSSVKIATGKVLRYAPDRAGGGGREKRPIQQQQRPAKHAFIESDSEESGINNDAGDNNDNDNNNITHVSANDSDSDF